MATVTICSDFGVQKKKLCTVPIVSPSICHEMMGPDTMILGFWMLRFFTLFFLFHQEALQFLFTFSHKGGVIYISEIIANSLNSLVFVTICVFHWNFYRNNHIVYEKTFFPFLSNLDSLYYFFINISSSEFSFC